MRIWVNGEPREVSDRATVADLLSAVGVPPSGMAVAVDGEVVPRTDWSGHRLPADARVEVLTAVQGG